MADLCSKNLCVILNLWSLEHDVWIERQVKMVCFIYGVRHLELSESEGGVSLWFLFLVLLFFYWGDYFLGGR